MLMCNERVTLVKHLREADGDRYLCIPVEGASWYAKTAVVKTEKGLTTGNVLKCRIPVGLLSEGEDPQKGDSVVRGKVEELRKAADLKHYEHFVITGVGDNRRGRFPHWVVSGS